MSAKKPRIGIPLRIEAETGRFYLGRDYSEALAAAGALPLHLSLIPERGYLDAALEGVEGILLPGSDTDVEPWLYGQEPHIQLGTVQPLKDETDLLILRESERRGLPILAICYGMQVLNVARGGTLIQDIVAQWPGAIKHQQGVPRERASHRIRLADESGLGRLAGSSIIAVSSHHHQAIGEVGENLRVTARSSDGIIEALEDTRPGRFVWAVQWHPEVGWAQSPLARSLFARFIEAAREFRAA